MRRPGGFRGHAFGLRRKRLSQGTGNPGVVATLEGSSSGPQRPQKPHRIRLGAPEVPRRHGQLQCAVQCGARTGGRRDRHPVCVRDEQLGVSQASPFHSWYSATKLKWCSQVLQKGGKVSAWERPTLPSPSVNPKVMVADPSDAGTKSTNRRSARQEIPAAGGSSPASHRSFQTRPNIEA